MIKLKFEFQNSTFMLPLNPENLEVSVANDTKKFDIIGLGQIAVPAQKGLRTISFECFFPAFNRPKKCVEFFENIMDSKKPVRFITEGLIKEVNMYMVIDDFSYDIRAGEEEDIYYTMSLTEYRPYGAKLEEIKSTANGNEVLPSTEDREDTKEPVTQTYVVKQGDSLWSITKNFSGSGGNWGSLYVINKEVIGGNPNLIYPGQVLTLPTEWKYVAVKVKSSGNTNTSSNKPTTSTSTSKPTTSNSNSTSSAAVISGNKTLSNFDYEQVEVATDVLVSLSDAPPYVNIAAKLANNEGSIIRWAAEKAWNTIVK